MTIYKNATQAKKSLRMLALQEAKIKFDVLQKSHSDLEKLSIDNLKNEINKIDEILLNNDENELKFIYKKGKDFNFPKSYTNFNRGYVFNFGGSLINKKKQILDIINTKKTETKIESISELINTIPDQDTRKELNQQFKELEEQASRAKIEREQLDKQEEQFNSEKQELELTKDKLDIFDKRSKIWLRIFGRESIASILGGFLLLIMTSCFLIAMFTGTEISNVIESAFFLILGYFFGQSVKNEK